MNTSVSRQKVSTTMACCKKAGSSKFFWNLGYILFAVLNTCPKWVTGVPRFASGQVTAQVSWVMQGVWMQHWKYKTSTPSVKKKSNRETYLSDSLNQKMRKLEIRISKFSLGEKRKRCFSATVTWGSCSTSCKAKANPAIKVFCNVYSP